MGFDTAPPPGRNPAVAAGLSAFVPGLGQWYAGRGRRAIIVALPMLGLVVAAIAAWQVGVVRLVELLVQPRVLWVVILLNLAFLGWRLFAVADAYRIANGGVLRWPGWLTSVVTFVVVVVVVAPHVVVTSYGLTSIDVLETVFVAGREDGADASYEPAPPSQVPFPPGDLIGEDIVDPALRADARAEAAVSSRNLIFRPGMGDPEAIAAWEAIVTADNFQDVAAILPPEDIDDVDRITILLVGGDGGGGRRGNRADSIMVASFDTETGKAALFSIPRNFAQFPLPPHLETAFVEQEEQLRPFVPRREWEDEDGDGDTDPPPFVSCKCFPDQINALYPWARGFTETYPDEVDPGLAALRDSLEIMLDLHIDYYAFVNMNGFVRVIDALGGVRVYVLGHIVTEVSPYEEGGEWISVDLAPGWHRLSGAEALAYVRERKTSNDYIRTKRQRCLLKAVAASADPVTIVRRFNSLARAVQSSVKTDVPLDFLPTLIGYAAELESADIATIGFVPPFFAHEVDHRKHPIPDLERIQAMVRWAFSADATTEFDSGSESECRI